MSGSAQHDSRLSRRTAQARALGARRRAAATRWRRRGRSPPPRLLARELQSASSLQSPCTATRALGLRTELEAVVHAGRVPLRSAGLDAGAARRQRLAAQRTAAQHTAAHLTPAAWPSLTAPASTSNAASSASSGMRCSCCCCARCAARAPGNAARHNAGWPCAASAARRLAGRGGRSRRCARARNTSPKLRSCARQEGARRKRHRHVTAPLRRAPPGPVAGPAPHLVVMVSAQAPARLSAAVARASARNRLRAARLLTRAPRPQAEHLASIFGTEKDRVNCPFFFKIGSCRCVRAPLGTLLSALP